MRNPNPIAIVTMTKVANECYETLIGYLGKEPVNENHII